MALLCADEHTVREGLPLAGLRPALGPDRSNARRIVGSLLRRGDVEWVSDPETGERRLRLTFLADCVALMRQRDDEGYDASDKFGTPEDAPQTYLLGDGREVEEEEFLEHLRKETAQNGGGRSRLYEADPADNS